MVVCLVQQASSAGRHGAAPMHESTLTKQLGQMQHAIALSDGVLHYVTASLPLWHSERWRCRDPLTPNTNSLLGIRHYSTKKQSAFKECLQV
jgi:hypothetical protein